MSHRPCPTRPATALVQTRIDPDTRHPAAALATDTAIARHAKRLRRFPHLGRPGRVEGTREFPLPRTPFIIACRAAEADLVLLRILHGARRWPPSEPAP